MANRLVQHGIGRTAAFLAAVVLVLPPLPAQACACAVQKDRQSCCGRCHRRAEDASHEAVKTCCAKHQVRLTRGCCDRHAAVALKKRLAGQSTHNSVCHCQHGRRPETPVVPVSQTHWTVDQLLLAQGAVSSPVAPAMLPASSASSACHEFCLAADMPLERCILLSRLTL